ncbi:cereblon family protein [Maridesulfovibrio sp.]|uniref:cereblon family protein n=1 Tax=Maridesulfovibrio sp. TaxID=2795000 RepID=UPI0039EF52E0
MKAAFFFGRSHTCTPRNYLFSFALSASAGYNLTMNQNNSIPPCSFLKSTPHGPDSGIEVEDKDEVRESEKKIITCRACGTEITDSSFATKVNENHEHSFFNPHGYVFQIRCFSAATGCATAGKPSNEFTWFSGYTWKVAVCRSCMTHLGWRFQSDSTSFYGLIRDKISEK